MTYKKYLKLKNHPGNALKNSKRMRMYGGCAPLNFVNTLLIKEDSRTDRLKHFKGFLKWCYEAGVIDDNYLMALNLEAHCYENDAAKLFDQVIITRMLLRDMIKQCINGGPADPVTTQHFDKMIKKAQEHITYHVAANGLEMVWVDIEEEMAAPLWMIILLTAELLQADDSLHIRQCLGCNCLFIDRTKNRSRQWCHLNACGSLFKTNRYYQKKLNNKLRTG